MKLNKLMLALFAGSLLFTSCSDNDDTSNDMPLGAYDNGILVLNEGNFGMGNAKISYISNDFGTFQNDIFNVVNPGMSLGDTGQDIGFYGDLAFVVLNASNTIEIVNRYTMQHVETIDAGLNNPRYIVFANGKGYVTNWGAGGDASDDYVAVLNLTDYTVASTISVAEGPEKIITYGDKLYVAHKGGWGSGNSVSVIDMDTNTVASTITVGDIPNSMVIQNATLYVLCSGKSAWPTAADETLGSLHKISLTGGANTSLNFAAGAHPSNLQLENGTLYFTNDAGIFSMSPSAAALPTSPLFSTTPQGVYGVYGFEVENGKIFVSDAVDYNSNGKVYIYSMTGTLEHDYTVNIIPSGFYFNN